MIEYTFRRVSIENDSEVKFIAEIDNTIPALFDSDFVVNEQMNQDRMKFLKACKEDDFFDVALDGDKRIVAFHVVKKVPHFDRFAGRVDTLWIAPEHRKKGLAAALKLRAEKWAQEQGLDHLHTWVHADNNKMISLNEKMGYQTVNYKMRKNQKDFLSNETSKFEDPSKSQARAALNLKLISPKLEDAHFWLQVRSQPSTQLNNPVGILSEDTLRSQIAESNSAIEEKKSSHRYYIQINESDFAGVISLKDINWQSGVCEIGYLIAERYQNRGVASQAVALIMQKAFAAGIKKIKATTFVKNVASYKALQKNGFVLEGHLKNEVLIQGQLQDMYLWAAYQGRSSIGKLDLDSGIRHARMSDAEPLHKLSFQLGYSPTFEEVRKRLAEISIHPDYEVLVIERNGEVLGWMTLSKRLLIEGTKFLQVAAIVTDERYRGQGLGRKLMAFAETRAREMKLPFVGLSSSKHRSESHRFYEAIGYSKVKESHFFKKDL